MLPRKSKLSAPDAERPVLASYWLTALLAGLVGGALWLMYPRQDLERRLLSSSSDSSLSLVYLKNLLRSDPNNPRLQQLLAQRVAEDEARKQREADLANRQPSPWTRWRDAMDGYHALPLEATEQRRALRADLVVQLHELMTQEVPTEVLPALAEDAFHLGEPLLGIQMYRRMGDEASAEGSAVALYERAAREALGVSAHQEAADLFLKARHASTRPDQAKAFYLRAIAAMQASGKPALALALAQREVGELEADPEVLRVLVELARAAGKPAIAEQYMKRLLRLALLQQWRETAVATAAPVMLPMSGNAAPVAPASMRYEDRAYLLDTSMLHHPSAAGMQQVATAQAGNRTGAEKAGPGLPFDDKIYTLGYQVFLENSNLEDAWLVAKSAVQQAPNDLAWRERLAQVAE